MSTNHGRQSDFPCSEEDLVALLNLLALFKQTEVHNVVAHMGMLGACTAFLADILVLGGTVPCELAAFSKLVVAMALCLVPMTYSSYRVVVMRSALGTDEPEISVAVISVVIHDVILQSGLQLPLTPNTIENRMMNVNHECWDQYKTIHM